MLWTPRRVARPPSLMLPFGVAGTEPIGYHSRIAGAPTITRAGVRYHRTGLSSCASVAENKHACEEDGTGKRYVSVYGERTNAITVSSPKATSPWAAIGSPTVAVDDAAAPDGGLANKITVSDANMLYTSIGGFVGATIATSFWIKRVSTTGTLLCQNTQSGAAGYWQIAMAGLPDAWVWIDRRSPYVSVSSAFAPVTGSGGTLFNAVSGDVSAHIWGVQQEDGFVYSGPTIPTAGAAVTKAAEVVAWPVADFGIPGSVECHFRTRDTVPTDKRIWSWYDADGDGAIELFLDADGHVHLRVHNGTGEVADIEVATAVNTGAWFPVRASWETNYVRLQVGDSHAIDTSCTMPALAALDASRLGASKAGQYLDGDIAEFRAHQRRII